MLRFVITFGGYRLQLREVQFGVKVYEAMIWHIWHSICSLAAQ